MPESSLAVLQQWMKSVVTEGLPAARQRHAFAIDDVVVTARGLSAEERLGIYARGYVMRLVECMRADFPALRAFLGDAVFDAFARAYIITTPPASPSLYDLSAGFSRFLEETRPASREHVLLDLPAELARLERAWGEVMRAPGIENDPPDADLLSFAAIVGGERTVEAAPCLRLLELTFPLVDFLRASHAGEHPRPPEPRRALVALGRSDYRVHAGEVAPWQYAFLRACERPSPLYAAAQRAAAESGRETARVLADVAVWLPVAASVGYLRVR